MNTIPTNLPHVPHDLHPKTSHVEHDPRPWLGTASVALAVLALAACAFPTIAMASLPLATGALAMGLLDLKKCFGRKGPWLALAVLGCVLSVAAFVTAAKIGAVEGRANDQAMSIPHDQTAPKSQAK